ncbi:uncharacterized protein LOC132644545 [Lycium barbarum]|uniref:uncharacterized protein LOC132644545 n=1 Tax=Lycium barbarum TaxID=112863 RepID=UPI00293E59EF|nr:uncharacterized protein LOC132644545 [Lycium barbarum]
MQKGPQLTHEQKLFLLIDVTDAEIKNGLWAIGEDKDHGVDGFNACFFKNSWLVVKDDIILAVKTGRLQSVIPSIIYEAQASFVPGRKIANNIVLAHELVMEGIGFPTKFTNWIMECVRTVNYSVVVNRKPTEPFDAAKVKEFRYHPRCAKLGITHLSFADDLLLFARGDAASVACIHECFNQFSAAFGLEANMEKSSIYFGGIAQGDKDTILRQLGYGQGELPLRYLGVPLTTKTLYAIQWQALIEKMADRISSWTAKQLSYAGRIQLVQTVLLGIQAYWSQLFQIPSKVMKLIEAHCRSYIWSGTNLITKRALVSWDKLCSTKYVGGLNLINLKLWNRAALTKSFWDLAHKQDKM